MTRYRPEPYTNNDPFDFLIGETICDANNWMSWEKMTHFWVGLQMWSSQSTHPTQNWNFSCFHLEPHIWSHQFTQPYVGTSVVMYYYGILAATGHYCWSMYESNYSISCLTLITKFKTHFTPGIFHMAIVKPKEVLNVGYGEPRS